MPKSPSIPVPVMMSMSLPFNTAIALNHLYSSIGIPMKILLNILIAPLFIRGNGIFLIGKAETLYVDAVSSGPEQIQEILAFGRYLRRLHKSACSVHSLPKFPAPKFPNRQIFRSVGSVPICHSAWKILQSRNIYPCLRLHGVANLPHVAICPRVSRRRSSAA